MSRSLSALVSRAFGKFASHRFPPSIQRWINRAYVGLMGLDMGEFDPPESYPSLNALFTRALRTPRPIDPDPHAVISPCDARVTDRGTITRGRAYQIKGMEYSVAELLGELADEGLEGGEYLNLYLSPRDYHRYHAPFDLEVHDALHIPGKLYPVNLPLLRRKKDLFVENERVVLRCSDRWGRIHIIVLVGALNVGKMVLVFDDRIRTNARSGSPPRYHYERPIALAKGELLGWFEMGSTIVMLSPPRTVRYRVETGASVRYAQTIGTLEG
ncbi:phosphatidylserine decarboxylase [Nitratifractor sp.]